MCQRKAKRESEHLNLVPSLCRRWERRMGMVFRLGSPAGSRPSNGHQVIFRGWSHGVIGGAGGVKNIWSVYLLSNPHIFIEPYQWMNWSDLSDGRFCTLRQTTNVTISSDAINWNKPSFTVFFCIIGQRAAAMPRQSLWRLLTFSTCLFITLIKCLKGRKSLGSLCNVKSKSTLSQLVSEWQGHLLSCSGQLKM